MKNHKTNAIVLSTKRFGEADRLVRALTETKGLRTMVAKGVRKMKSKFGGKLVPFAHVLLYFHEGRNLDTFIQAEVIDSFSGLRKDLGKIACASAMSRICLAYEAAGEQGSAAIYKLLLGHLAALERAERDYFQVFLSFQAKFLALAGVSPSVDRCCLCGKDVICMQGFFFSMKEGGIVCEACANAAGGAQRISSGCAMLLRRLFAESEGFSVAENEMEIHMPGEEVTRETLVLMNAFMGYHADKSLDVGKLLWLADLER